MRSSASESLQADNPSVPQKSVQAQGLDGQNHQSPIASVQQMLSTHARHSAVPRGADGS